MMLARSALLVALLAAASQSLPVTPAVAGHSEPSFSTASVGPNDTKTHLQAASRPQQAQPTVHDEASALVLQPNPAIPGDIVGGRGPNAHLRELHDIAVAADLGNNDRVDMLTKQARQFGVTREAIQRYQDGVRLHGDGRPAAPQAEQFGQYKAASPREAAWEAGQ